MDLTPQKIEMKWNEKPIVPWRAKASSFEGQLNVYACDELFRMHDLKKLLE